MSVYELLGAKRSRSINDCRKQAERIHRQLETRDLAGDDYERLRTLLDQLLEELEEYSGQFGNDPIEEDTRLYNLIDDIIEQARRIE